MKIAQESTYAVDDAANVRRALLIDTVFNELGRHDGRIVESRLNYDFSVKSAIQREREEASFPVRTEQGARWRRNFQISLFFDTFGAIIISFQNFLLIFRSQVDIPELSFQFFNSVVFFRGPRCCGSYGQTVQFFAMIQTKS